MTEEIPSDHEHHDETLLQLVQRFAASDQDYGVLSSMLQRIAETYRHLWMTTDQYSMSLNGDGGIVLSSGDEEDTTDDDIDEDDHYIENPRDAIEASSTRKDLVEVLQDVRIEEELGMAETCTICLENFSLGSKARRMLCLHVYHEDCIAKWLAKSNSCPLCRYELSAT